MALYERDDWGRESLFPDAIGGVLTTVPEANRLGDLRRADLSQKQIVSTICGVHNLSQKQIAWAICGGAKSSGRVAGGGFEPPKALAGDFTGRSLWPLGHPAGIDDPVPSSTLPIFETDETRWERITVVVLGRALRMRVYGSVSRKRRPSRQGSLQIRSCPRLRHQRRGERHRPLSDRRHRPHPPAQP
jgi:hypothetical protein